MVGTVRGVGLDVGTILGTEKGTLTRAMTTAQIADRLADRPTEAEIERDAYHLPISAIVAYLAEIAGVVVTGTIGNVATDRAVRHWIAGDRVPDHDPQLRFGYRIARMIESACGSRAVQAWFKGSNTSLHDRAPALVLRDDFSEQTQHSILGAARRIIQ